MDKISVKEFEKFGVNQDFWAEKKQISEKSFEALCTLLDEDNPPFKVVGKETLRTSGLVGVVSVPGTVQVEILPKIYRAQESQEADKKLFFDMLQAVTRLKIDEHREDSGLETQGRDVFEMFISYFIQESQELVKRGIKSSYTTVEENLNFYRGRLLVREQIRHNAVHAERFYVSYDEFSMNRPENRLIKTALNKLIRVSNDKKNISDLRKLLFAFEEVPVSYNVDGDFKSIGVTRKLEDIKLDRTLSHYAEVVRWVQFIIYSISPVPLTGEKKAWSFLFKMNDLFEAYVAQKMQESGKANKDIEICSQFKGGYIFNKPKKFKLIPDIVIKKGDKKIAVLDTKWKVLEKDEDIDQADMYQMFAYSQKLKCENIYLLYPENENFDGHKCFESKNPKFRVHIKFIAMNNEEETLKSINKILDEILDENQRSSMCS